MNRRFARLCQPVKPAAEQVQRQNPFASWVLDGRTAAVPVMPARARVVMGKRAAGKKNTSVGGSHSQASSAGGSSNNSKVLQPSVLLSQRHTGMASQLSSFNTFAFGIQDSPVPHT